jgi:isocitrate/isopropylmalate dehydrogenase
MSRTSYEVTCLARHGIGPEVMAAASRALAATSRLHGFAVDEHYVPFGADAVTRFGRAFPLPSRRAILDGDAVLVAARGDSALTALEAELDLRSSIVRIRYDGTSELSLLAPLADEAWEPTLAHAFSLARSSRARIALVGVDGRWGREAAEFEVWNDGIDVEYLDARAALRMLVLTPRRFDVLVCPPELCPLAAELAAGLASDRISAWGRLAATPPSIFGAAHGVADELAGHGVADPSSMLLAAALMLGEGLGERSAAATLSGAIGLASPNGNGVAKTSSRDHADSVLAYLPLALGNAEFHREAV